MPISIVFSGPNSHHVSILPRTTISGRPSGPRPAGIHLRRCFRSPPPQRVRRCQMTTPPPRPLCRRYMHTIKNHQPHLLRHKYIAMAYSSSFTLWLLRVVLNIRFRDHPSLTLLPASIGILLYEPGLSGVPLLFINGFQPLGYTNVFPIPVAFISVPPPAPWARRESLDTVAKGATTRLL